MRVKSSNLDILLQGMVEFCTQGINTSWGRFLLLENTTVPDKTDK